MCSFEGLSVCYLPKFTFWQVCWFKGLSVCLFDRLFIRSWITLEPFEISSPKLVHRCILVAAPSLLLLILRSKVKGQGHEVNAKVKIRNRRNSVHFLATAKFEKKTHNVVLLKAHLYDIINFRYHFRFKRSPEVENRKYKITISIFVSFQHSSNLIAYLETTCQILYEILSYVLMTLPMTSQHSVKHGPLYSCLITSSPHATVTSQKWSLFNDTYQIYVSQWSYLKLWVSRSKVKCQGHDISRNAQIKNNKNLQISVNF